MRILCLAVLLCTLCVFPATAAEETSIPALRKRLETLRILSQSDVCAHPQEARALLKLSAIAAPVVPTGGGASVKALSRTELAAQLHQAVVLVLAGQGSGSGFFITPDLVITNRHVVIEGDPSKIIVMGQGTGGPKQAQILVMTSKEDPGGRDYAVLRVSGATSPFAIPLTAQTSDLEQVVAAGFPGLLLENDSNFRALLGGNMAAMPNLALSQGAVMARQNRERGLPTIAHSAPISGGNSGGPLVDSCGRVIGINTFINIAAAQGAHAGFAISSEDIIRYLNEQKIEFIHKEGGCE